MITAPDHGAIKGTTMKTTLILTAAALTAFAGGAIAGPAERKAEAFCTGAATSDDYPRWSLVTDTCDQGENICTIERRDGETASYSCPKPDSTDNDGDDSSGGSGAKPRPIHQQ